MLWGLLTNGRAKRPRQPDGKVARSAVAVQRAPLKPRHNMVITWKLKVGNGLPTFFFWKRYRQHRDALRSRSQAVTCFFVWQIRSPARIAKSSGVEMRYSGAGIRGPARYIPLDSADARDDQPRRDAGVTRQFFRAESARKQPVQCGRVCHA